MKILGLGYTIIALMLGGMALIIISFLYHQRKEQVLKRLVRFWAAYTLVAITLEIDFGLRNFLRMEASFVYCLFLGLMLMYFINLALVAYLGLVLEVKGFEVTKTYRKLSFILVFLPLYFLIPVMKLGSTPADLQWVFHTCAWETGIILCVALIALFPGRKYGGNSGQRRIIALFGFTIIALGCAIGDYVFGGPNYFFASWPKAFYGTGVFYGVLALAMVVKGIQTLLKLHSAKESVITRNWGDALPVDLVAGYGISEREKEIAEAVLRGMTNSEIAAAKCIAVSTVKKHISNLFLKTNARNRVELIHILQGRK